jgi:hypothetical protein
MSKKVKCNFTKDCTNAKIGACYHAKAHTHINGCDVVCAIANKRGREIKTGICKPIRKK